ncbi:MAG: alpha-glucosidase/alpha-galactosidase [Anaerolineae bacterium]|jgi:alpha-galactosidase|nr:alpha-glucosidase/alpha-galactosidase [Anaerolineae bacterium]MBT4460212.1 alpha-glucosidase/alpha-galactosidase [Anaerolineae bacterium]MBT6062821.1 alpha-glucosidase/alpha-galactosidase [Anaerolineae bacterium]MBT6323472.1 alpha-glucosidase/alpha-galactosidase [Anaerolineae bacterium]MBT7016564.1 alpha-glucosidase/alpha-galactosidase [Anaerolineae bacterium]
MSKITILGAGSTVFAKNLIGDILSLPELAESTISLHDIDAERLETTRIVTERIARGLGVVPFIETHLDRRAALVDANYVIGIFQVGGYEPATVTDFEIPKKYGLRQTIGDTLGIGGIMRGLRTIPVYLDMARDMEELCPDAVLLNYVNPMSMVTWALNKATKIKILGLCHSVQGTAEQLAEDINVPIEEINYLAAGINHLAFYLKFERDGVDLYPAIRRVAAEDRIPSWNKVRYEMLTRLGYSVTESSEHFAEYVPWFIKRDRPDLIEKFNIPLDEYIRRCEVQIAGWEATKATVENPDVPVDIPAMNEKLKAAGASDYELEVMAEMLESFDNVAQSHEYGAYIIHSLETGTPRVIYGNVMNDGLIENLPQDCCVEVPVLVDKNGLQPTKVGALPPHLAALMQTNINVQSLTVEAALTGKREHIYHAAMLDPHTAAELDLDQTWSLVDDLIAAHGDWLPEFE